MKWLNESAGTLSDCEQLEPVLENGQIIHGYMLNGEFRRDPKGPDILHQPIHGQLELEDDDPLVLAHLARVNRVKTLDERVEDEMNSLSVASIKAALNSNGQADQRMRTAIRAKLEAETQASSSLRILR